MFGSTKVKQKSSTTHKSLIETTEKANAALVDSINHIHAVNIQIENKWTWTQDEILQKQLAYFKFRNTKINQIQLIGHGPSNNMAYRSHGLGF